MLEWLLSKLLYSELNQHQLLWFESVVECPFFLKLEYYLCNTLAYIHIFWMDNFYRLFVDINAVAESLRWYGLSNWRGRGMSLSSDPSVFSLSVPCLFYHTLVHRHVLYTCIRGGWCKYVLEYRMMWSVSIWFKMSLNQFFCQDFIFDI